MSDAGDIVRDRDLPTERARSPVAREFTLTDLGNAERLVARHGEDLRYAPGVGWLVWDGRRFARDTTGEVVQRMAETVRALYAEAQGTADDAERKRLAKHALDSERETRLRAALAIAQTDPEIVVEPDDLDVSELLVNVGNGVLHLEIGELLDHDRAYLMTKLTNVKFFHDAEAPTWLRFLERITDGRPELVTFLQRAVGYTLAGDPKEQCALLLYGVGSNGKTTFVETLRALFGEYGQQTPAETFLERKGGIPSDVARLRGARFVSAVEMPEGRRLNEVLVKRLTGSDTITARHLYRDYFDFRPRFVPWVATNARPEIRGTDHAIWRRLRLIPFDVTITPEERDPDLPEKLRAELPGILRWAVNGYLDYTRHGLEPPDAVTAATASYRSDMDIVGGFIDECCLVREDLTVQPSDLWQAFEEHVGRANGMSPTAFYLDIKRRGFEKQRNGRRRWYRGLALLTADPTLLDSEGGDR